MSKTTSRRLNSTGEMVTILAEKQESTGRYCLCRMSPMQPSHGHRLEWIRQEKLSMP
jgi:hypothetical protein